MPSLFQNLGLAETKEEREKRQRSDRARIAGGLLGSSPQEAIIGDLGRFGVQLQASQQGSGYLGSDKGVDATSQLVSGLQGAGFAEPQIQSLLASSTEQTQKPTTLMQNLLAGGVDLNTKSGQKTMLDAVMKPQTQINMGNSAGTMWTPEQVKNAGLPEQSVVTTDKYGKPQLLNKEKYTQPQILSGTYATRMNDATESISKIMEAGFDPAGIVQNADQFGVPSILANYARSPEGQQYRQAQENWISANLRKESGAAIPEEEMDREIKKWFPQPGDKPGVIAQKSMSRKTAARGMQKAAGGAYQELIDKAESDRLSDLRGKHGAK